MSPKERFVPPIDHAYRVPFDGSFRVPRAPTAPPKGAARKRAAREALGAVVVKLEHHQRRLYADNRYAVLCIFQAMDAAGKDSTIRAVMTGVNPAGFQVYSFKQPSAEELDHDFLWRTARRLPERGRIGIFNRSYYEEVLVVRVHPEYLDAQRLPFPTNDAGFWKARLQAIREHERYLARNGVVILKFWLNVSRAEQKKRFLSRLETPHKQWKFSKADLTERAYWDDYMRAYEVAIAETSRPWAPWFAIPADDKPHMRLTVAEILDATFDRMNLSYPETDEVKRRELLELAKVLESDD